MTVPTTSPQHAAADAPVIPGPRHALRAVPPAGLPEQRVPSRRRPPATAWAVVGRLGSVVTLLAMLVLAAAVSTAVNGSGLSGIRPGGAEPASSITDPAH
ncbi:MAG: hypothetical protein OJJ54_20635 [Pseudonocardia sp.]|nr:hypothetical protein [Pseudonocardia sp.]